MAHGKTDCRALGTISQDTGGVPQRAGGANVLGSSRLHSAFIPRPYHIGMRVFTSLAFALFAATGFAQGVFINGVPNRAPSQAQVQAFARASANQAAIVSLARTETVRVLSLASVQKELSITRGQYMALDKAAATLNGKISTEDEAASAVSMLLTEEQNVRLQELLIQDMGYGALALSGVREKLSLTADQSSRITEAVTTLTTAKTAILTGTNDASTAGKALGELARTVNTTLSKVLTGEQDKAFRALAGKSLGSKSQTPS